MFLLLLQATAAQASCPLQNEPISEVQQIKASELNTVLTKAKGCQTLVEVWASWCGPCVSLAPHITQFHLENPDVLMLSVSVDNSHGAMKQFVKTHEVPGHLYHLNPWTMADLKATFEPFGLVFPERIPYVVLLDSQGTVLNSLTEPADLNDLKTQTNTKAAN